MIHTASNRFQGEPARIISFSGLWQVGGDLAKFHCKNNLLLLNLEFYLVGTKMSPDQENPQLIND